MRQPYIDVHQLSKIPININEYGYTSKRYARTSKFTLSRKGRWGPQWLHGLVVRIATNLGMISHYIDEIRSESIRRGRIDLQDMEIAEKIYKVSRPFLNDGAKPDDLIIIMGRSEFRDLEFKLFRSLSFDYQVRIGKNGVVNAYGFEIWVTDHLEGVIAVRRPGR